METSIATGHPQRELTDRLIRNYLKLAASFREHLERQDLAIMAMGILRVAHDMLDASEYIRLIADTAPTMRQGTD